MKRDLATLGLLVGRHCKIFLKDKAAVFFSLLAPMIILALYILFLGDVQMSAVESGLGDAPVDASLLRAFVDGWMLAGVMSVACITVAFSSQNMMIRDREEGMSADMYASPVKRGVLTASYFLYNCCVTLAICGIVLAVAFLYLAIAGWYLSALDVLAILGLTVVSVLSASLLGTLVCALIRTGNAHGALVGILSAAVGFLVGAYMPLSMFPKAIQYLVLFLPGTYSAAVFRTLFMDGALGGIAAVAPEAAESLSEMFTMRLDFFGTELSSGAAFAVLAGSVALFAAINALAARRRERGLGRGRRLGRGEGRAAASRRADSRHKKGHE